MPRKPSAKTLKSIKAARHEWDCLGGGGGWEVWECRLCDRRTIPSAFGFLWPDLLRFVVPSMRCVP